MDTYDADSSHAMINTIRLTTSARLDNEKAIETGLCKLNGVFDVDVAAKGARVTVTYDLQRIRLNAIEEALASLGYPLDDSLPAQALRGLQHYFEDNEADALGASLHNCYRELADLHKNG